MTHQRYELYKINEVHIYVTYKFIIISKSGTHTPIAEAAAAPVAATTYSEPAPAAVAPVAGTVVEAAPVEAAAPAADPSSSQYHAQDDLGQYNYGYSNPNSAKVETKSADGIVRGSYTYIDAHGKLQTVQYISDAFGFRVAATNLPVHVVDQGGNSVQVLV